MDEICSAVLKKICDLGGFGNFIIAELCELCDVLSDDYEDKNKVIESALKRLKTEGFIEIKYSREQIYCLSALKKPEIEIAPTATTPVLKKRTYYLCAGCGFLGAFLGGLLACLITG